ncbi:neugrin [Stegastes partitus]|uniref:Neugrin n=1 Tax=Stegastes partitus TaxID=144197 RepID=A0A3B4ZWR7_9TELE|nr:PREDICTED: neugrin [Stegastes partitus]
MARSLLSLLSRLGALSATPSVPVNSCRFASRGANKAWPGQSHVNRDRNRHSKEVADGELDLEDVEDKFQALVDQGRKRQKTVKFHILRRQMTPPGAPQRMLTWDAIEQIRYLKQEQPEEWTVQRLAEGFSVTPDVILRVLRSKFVPSPERKAKQNNIVMAELSQQVLPSGAGTQQDKLKLPGSRTPAILPSGSTEGALVPVAEQTRMIRGEGSGSSAKSPVPATVVPTQLAAGISQAVAATRLAEDTRATNTTLTDEDEEDEDDEDDEEGWDGQVLTEEELEEFMDMEKPSPLMQVGKDFFDAEGNFMYRV